MIGTTVLEIYTVTRLLGEGGMGSVFIAESGLGHRIVVKVLRPELAARPDMLRRFTEEGRAVAQARHPNNVEVFGIGRLADGGVYLAMEFLDGKTLTAHIESWGPMSCEAVLPILVQLCAGLQVAHRRSIVHRDIKPDNVFICDYPTRGTVKILDFGLARFLVDNMTQTQSRAFMGTPAYMAPEQAANAKRVTPAADIFSVAVVAFELLTGRRPYAADSPLSLLDGYAQIAAGRAAPPRLVDAAPGRDIPSAWHEQIERGFSVSPDARPQTIRAFIEPMIAAITGGREIADAIAPSLLESVGPADATRRAPRAPLAGGVETPVPAAPIVRTPIPELRGPAVTVTGRQTAPPLVAPPPASPPAMSPRSTLHDGSGAYTSPPRMDARRRYLVPVLAIGVAGIAVVATISALSGRERETAPGSTPTDAGEPASIADAAISDAIPSADAAAPPDADAPPSVDARTRRGSRPQAGSGSNAAPGSGSALVGDGDGDIFQ